MKPSDLTKPPERPCVVCRTLGQPYGRTRYGDILCTRKCQSAWDKLSWEERLQLHERSKREKT